MARYGQHRNKARLPSQGSTTTISRKHDQHRKEAWLPLQWITASIGRKHDYHAWPALEGHTSAINRSRITIAMKHGNHRKEAWFPLAWWCLNHAQMPCFMEANSDFFWIHILVSLKAIVLFILNQCNFSIVNNSGRKQISLEAIIWSWKQIFLQQCWVGAVETSLSDDASSAHASKSFHIKWICMSVYSCRWSISPNSTHNLLRGLELL